MKVDLFYPSLKKSLVGVYDDPERDPREHVVGIAFLSKIVGGEIKPRAKVNAVNSFSETEVKNWKSPLTTGKQSKKSLAF